LFTDIEGSTRRWEADADAMRAALLAHDEVLRRAVEAHSGYVFSHTGDGVVAAFTSPRSAVDAAIAAQRALELPVRMGIATGEAELRDGDYFGAVLNRAARVMAEIGDDRARFADARGLKAFAGSAPITRASGKKTIVLHRHIKNRRLAAVGPIWALTALRHSPGARRHYDARRAAGDWNHQTQRHLFNRLLGQLHHCLQTGQLYNSPARGLTLKYVRCLICRSYAQAHARIPRRPP
jgi:transposase